MSHERDSNLVETQLISENELEAIQARRRGGEIVSAASLLLYHRDGVQAVPLPEGRPLVIGRFPPADVTVRDSSLSRLHASVERVANEVWIEDLESTNGTWVDGVRISRTQLHPDSDLTLGTVRAALHLAPGGDPHELELVGHDRFAVLLSAEVARARAHARGAVLLLVRAADTKAGHPARWLATLRELLRPWERLSLYSEDTVELLLPERSLEEATEFARTLRERQPGLRCGLAALPDHAGSADALLEAARGALVQSTADNPVVTPAGSASGHSLVSGQTGEDDQGPVLVSAAMRAVFDLVDRAAATSLPVLIVGETGSGKEIVARALHERSPRKSGPLIYVNCGALPEHLVESTLFGHERGAFTGATARAQGMFEAADGGTLLLDEIGELPPGAQAALLRVLENRRFSRVGGNQEIEVDVRVLAATHCDLQAMCVNGEFREDLLFRLNVMTIEVPPLRARVDEVEPLAQRFLRRAVQEQGRSVQAIHPEALELLQAHPWPGNVRELRNVIERAVVISSGTTISIEDLPAALRSLVPLRSPVETVKSDGAGPCEGEVINLRAELERIERDYILRALQGCLWDRAAAARNLGLPLRTLARKIQQLELREDERAHKSSGD